MKPYLVKTPELVQRSLSERVWAFPNEKKTIFLTFDDGPIPEVTPWVLKTLSTFDAKATFFCIGDNIKKHPAIFQQVLEQEHTIGNHTFHHLNGRNTTTQKYIQDVALYEKQLEATMSKLNEPLTTNDSQLTTFFRPPYGRMSSKQVGKLKKKGYKIIMWDVLSGDFDKTISEEKCFQNVIKNIQPGSIVVFHDSLKAEKNLRYSLPKVLEFIKAQGWSCASI